MEQPASGAGPAETAGGATPEAVGRPLPEGVRRRVVAWVSVAFGGLTATSQFTVTRLLANFSPSQGDPTRLMVRFSVAGFGLVDKHPDVYVHYITPGGRLKQTVRLGQATGQCGRIVRTAKRRLFPFARPGLGKWNLQFDTTRSFALGNRNSKFLFYSVGVCLQPPGARKPTSKSPCPQQVKS